MELFSLGVESVLEQMYHFLKMHGNTLEILMRLTEVTIRNFKAIKDTTISLANMTVIVGANGSGKSSVLQALHWMFQSGRNPVVSTNKLKNADFRQSDGSTLSEKDATYIPSPEYRNASHGDEYGNKKKSPQMEVEINAVDDNGDTLQASMWIKSARNEGLSVHVPSNNQLVQTIRDQKREFSAYIPGLAGIASSEERRTKLIIHRQAAAGDANTVLRNVLFLLKGVEYSGKSGLRMLQDYVSRVMERVSLTVDFDEERNLTIQAYFQIGSMFDRGRKKPLELAGIGFLQVIQIFAYLIYFRPRLLLVDEPDAHLHPSAQERLVGELAKAAENFGTQIILTTHSPSVVRALPSDAQVVWMKNGRVQQDRDDSARHLMGWGLLDKKILLLTEDSKTGMLHSILSQWPELERVVALWPLHGSNKLLDANACASLQNLFGDKLKIVLHRDRDFMMPIEADIFKKPYEDKGVAVWLTQHSDIESYWADKEVIRVHFEIDDGKATELLDDALAETNKNDAARKKRNRKRNDIRNKLNECKKGDIDSFNDNEVIEQYSKEGGQYVVLGKDLISKLRGKAKEKGLKKYNSFAKGVPSGCNGKIALDLKSLLEGLIEH